MVFKCLRFYHETGIGEIILNEKTAYIVSNITDPRIGVYKADVKKDVFKNVRKIDYSEVKKIQETRVIKQGKLKPEFEESLKKLYKELELIKALQPFSSLTPAQK